jgi:hypothetical protein
MLLKITKKLREAIATGENENKMLHLYYSPNIIMELPTRMEFAAPV